MSAALFQPPSGRYGYEAVVIPVHDDRQQRCVSSSTDPPRVSASANVTGSFGTVNSAALKRRRAIRSPTKISDREGQYALIAKFVKSGERITQKQLAEAQRRYVKNPETLLFLLKKDIQDLKQDIRDQEEVLREKYQLSNTVGSPLNQLVGIVTGYFRLIRRGYVAGITSNLLGFMREVSAPDVMFNMEYGPDAIEQHWCLSQWFGNVEVEVEGFHGSPCHSLVVITTTRVTITRETLRNVFPHLRTTDNSDRNCTLVEQLLNQRLVMRGSISFDWDESTCRLARM